VIPQEIPIGSVKISDKKHLATKLLFFFRLQLLRVYNMTVMFCFYIIPIIVMRVWMWVVRRLLPKLLAASFIINI